MRRPTWTGTATPVTRQGKQARKIFVFDLDRGRPKPRRDVGPAQCTAKIVGERRRCNPMHMVIAVDMTVVNIEFADQLSFWASVMHRLQA